MRGRARMLLLLLATLVPGTGTAADVMRDLFDGSRRVLLVFSPAVDDARAAHLDAALDDARCGVVERDLVIVRLPFGGEATVDGAPGGGAAASALRERYRVDDDGFAVVLIGKDGGEKARYPQAPELSRVFALIDGMPMRRAEMRGHTSTCGS